MMPNARPPLVPGFERVEVSALDEGEAFDHLGPRSRAALMHGPIKLLALPYRDLALQMGRDPREPAIDEGMARHILRVQAAAIGDRDPIDVAAGMRPLRRHGIRRAR